MCVIAAIAIAVPTVLLIIEKNKCKSATGYEGYCSACGGAGEKGCGCSGGMVSIRCPDCVCDHVVEKPHDKLVKDAEAKVNEIDQVEVNVTKKVVDDTTTSTNPIQVKQGGDKLNALAKTKVDIAKVLVKVTDDAKAKDVAVSNSKQIDADTLISKASTASNATRQVALSAKDHLNKVTDSIATGNGPSADQVNINAAETVKKASEAVAVANKAASATAASTSAKIKEISAEHKATAAKGSLVKQQKEIEDTSSDVELTNNVADFLTQITGATGATGSIGVNAIRKGIEATKKNVDNKTRKVQEASINHANASDSLDKALQQAAESQATAVVSSNNVKDAVSAAELISPDSPSRDAVNKHVLKTLAQASLDASHSASDAQNVLDKAQDTKKTVAVILGAVSKRRKAIEYNTTIMSKVENYNV